MSRGWLKALVDGAAIVMATTVMGVITTATLEGGSSNRRLPIFVGILALGLNMAAAFLIGCVRSGDRASHLIRVAVLVWLLNLPGVVLVPGVTVIKWGISLIPLVVAFAVGGALSVLVVPEETEVSEEG